MTHKRRNFLIHSYTYVRSKIYISGNFTVLKGAASLGLRMWNVYRLIDQHGGDDRHQHKQPHRTPLQNYDKRSIILVLIRKRPMVNVGAIGMGEFGKRKL